MKLFSLTSFIVASSAVVSAQLVETTAISLTGRYSFNENDFTCHGNEEKISQCGYACLKVFSGIVSSKGSVKFGDFPTIPGCKCMDGVALRQVNGIVDIRSTDGTNNESDMKTAIWSGYNLACFGKINADPFCQASTADGLLCSGSVSIVSRNTTFSKHTISTWGRSKKEILGEYRVVKNTNLCVDQNNYQVVEGCAKVVDLFQVSINEKYNNLVYSGFRRIGGCMGMRGLRSQVNDYTSARANAPSGEIIYSHHASDETKTPHIQCQHIKIPGFSYDLTRCISKNADGIKCSGIYTINGEGESIDIFGSMSFGIPLNGRRVMKQVVYNAMTNYTTYLDGVVSNANKFANIAYISF